MTDEEIFKMLYDVMFKLQISQHKLAEKMGVTATHLSNLLNGKSKLAEKRRRLIMSFFRSIGFIK